MRDCSWSKPRRVVVHCSECRVLNRKHLPQPRCDMTSQPARKLHDAARPSEDAPACRQKGRPALCRRQQARHHPQENRRRLSLCRAGRQAGARRSRTQAHPRAGDPAGLGRCLDLPAGPWPHPGHRTRRKKAQAVPLSRAMAQRARRIQVRAHAELWQRAAAHPRPGQ